MKATQPCSVADCDAPARSRGYCQHHYDRWNRNGDPLAGRQPPTVRLAARLEETPSGCLEWTGRRLPQGYGHISVKGVNTLTHRLAWELANGAIPDGMFACHRCDNPPCCNPDHLFLGSPADNTADMIAKARGSNGRAARTACPRGHRYDDENTYVNRKGERVCRACSKARWRARYHAARSA